MQTSIEKQQLQRTIKALDDSIRRLTLQRNELVAILEPPRAKKKKVFTYDPRGKK